MPAAPEPRLLCFMVNGSSIRRPITGHETLAEFLRGHLGLTGTKIACDQAACGACTVLCDGEAVFACHLLAAQAEGAAITTIEGIGTAESLDPLQQAFIAHDSLQCGYCTPGMIMALKAALDRGVAADRAVLAEAISANTCRCGAYEAILDAAMDVAMAQRP